jgi:hypothetical protein
VVVGEVELVVVATVGGGEFVVADDDLESVGGGVCEGDEAAVERGGEVVGVVE